MVRNRGLGYAAAVGEIAGADGTLRAKLAKDRQSGRIRNCLKEKDVGIGGPFHARMISRAIDIDKYQYSV
jgi:hypothetical protein